MPNIGPLELAIVAIIALVVFGPNKLPELGSSLGKGLREFKSSISGEDPDDGDAEKQLLGTTTAPDAHATTATSAPEQPAPTRTEAGPA